MAFAFWSRVEGRGSRVEGKWSRVEQSSTIIFERRQIKIPCLLEFPVPVLFLRLKHLSARVSFVVVTLE